MIPEPQGLWNEASDNLYIAVAARTTVESYIASTVRTLMNFPAMP